MTAWDHGTEKHCARIRRAYRKRSADATPLFRTLLAVADEIGLDAALSCLERCVTEKRTAWLGEHLDHLELSGDPLRDGYHLFYEVYLGLSVPADGEIVEQDERRMVTRWWNRCPTLEACQALALDTRTICRAAYHGPVQAFLSGIDPRLRFDRNYAALRPYTPYCEEILSLAE
jgi:tRNA(adenine34) deaminase